MARRGGSVDFNSAFFDEIMKTERVGRLAEEAAKKAREIAYESAPVDTGAYREGLTVEPKNAKYRRVFRVVGHDPKTLLIESKTGNLARALRKVKS